MASALLFVLGTAFGSFLNVLALRYDPDKFIFHKEAIGGRSRCPHCGKKLRWHELLPLVSFAVQRGRCRTCSARLSWQYPAVEILSGLIFVFVPRGLEGYFFLSPYSYFLPAVYYAFSALWILSFLVLLLAALIDIRLYLIPDELSAGLVILGAAGAYLLTPYWGAAGTSFLGSYELLFGLRENVWLNRAAAAALGAVVLGSLVLLTRGRGMGAGDVKLIFALGVLFGWPEIIFILAFGFIFGSAVGLALIALGQKKFKGFVPFGPFLAAASVFVFFFGREALDLYFWLFSLN